MDFNHDIGTIFNGLQTLDVTDVPPLGGTAGVLSIIGTGAVQLTLGTTAQRPTGSAGMTRFNTDNSTLEFFNGTVWVDAGRQGTVTSVAVTGSTGLVVGGSPITTAGTISLTLDAELQGLSQITTTGILVKTAPGVFTSRSIVGTTGNVVVTNGDAIAGNVTIDLAAVIQASSGVFSKVTLDSFGRVIGNLPVVTSDITALVDTVYVNTAGDTMTGVLNMGGNVITNLGVPTAGTDAVTKNYVDGVVSGLSWKQAVKVATVAPGTLATSFAAGEIIDGVTLIAGERILIKNQTDATENGIYIVQATGAPIRADDANTGAELRGASVYVESGTVNQDTGWSQTTNGTIVLGSSPIVWAQFSGSGAFTAGAGLTLTGNTFSLTAPVATSLGGTGLLTIGGANQILGVNAGGTGLEYKSVSAGTGISITHATGTLTINNTGVTSVGLSAPAIFSVSDSPVTSTGTLGLALVAQPAGTVFAAPATISGVPTFRALTTDDLPLDLYAENAGFGIGPVATGSNAVAIGRNANATGTSTVAIGNGSVASVFGTHAYANGIFTNDGDAQRLHAVLRNITTTNTVTELFLDGTAATQRLVIPNNSVVTFEIMIASRRTDATGGGAGYRFQGVIRKDTTSASTSFIGTPAKVIHGELNSVWDANVVADTTNGSLRVNVTGENGKTVRWVAVITAAIVTN